MEAPTMAGYGSATDLAPQDAFRPLLGASWPELARRYLQEHGPLTVSQDAVEAVLRLKVLCVPLVMHLNRHVCSLSHADVADVCQMVLLWICCGRTSPYQTAFCSVWWKRGSQRHLLAPDIQSCDM